MDNYTSIWDLVTKMPEIRVITTFFFFFVIIQLKCPVQTLAIVLPHKYIIWRTTVAQFKVEGQQQIYPVLPIKITPT